MTGDCPVDQSLSGRIALVTGGVRGIGAATAEWLAGQGATVIVGDISGKDDAEVSDVMARLPDDAAFIQLDVASESSWRSAQAMVDADFGRLDILVNNAGVECVGPVETVSLPGWQKMMAINVDGTFLGVKTMRGMLESAGAQTPAGSAIVNVSSILGMVGMADMSPYCASKGAVRSFTKAIAIEFASKSIPIRANSVHPGFVHTPMMDRGMEAAEAMETGAGAAMLAGLSQATPVGRVARPSEIAEAIGFLASDRASFCNGSELAVDGGWTAQ